MANDLANAADGGADSAILLGSVNVEMNLPSGTVITTASYALTGPNAFSRATTVDFPSTGNIALGIDSIPQGSGYQLSLQVASPDGSNVCTSVGQFGVVGNMSTVLVLVPHCSDPPQPAAQASSAGQESPAGQASQTGTLELTVDFPGGIAISTLSISIAGTNGSLLEESVTVSNDASVTVDVKDLPAGTVQTVSLQATSADGSESCKATSPVNILSDDTTRTLLTLMCASVGGATGQ